MSKFEKEQVFDYPSVLIAGYGIVGKEIKKEFPFAETYDPDVDMGADYVFPPEERFDYCFVCVPTPMLESGECATHYVKQAISQINAPLFIVRSTVPPGTTDYLSDVFSIDGKRIVFIPEYEGATQHVTKKNWVAIGTSSSKDYHLVRQLYELVHNGYFEFVHTSAKEAEISKYMVNSFLAMKVVFCNEFAALCKEEGVLYENVRDIFVKDERIGPSHTFVYDDYPGYDSKCFNKDLPAIVAYSERKSVTLNLVEATIYGNKKLRTLS